MSCRGAIIPVWAVSAALCAGCSTGANAPSPPGPIAKVENDGSGASPTGIDGGASGPRDSGSTDDASEAPDSGTNPDQLLSAVCASTYTGPPNGVSGNVAAYTPPKGQPSAIDVDCSRLTISGDPASAAGASWRYSSTDQGVVYDFTGVLAAPPGSGTFPGIIVNHGHGGSPLLSVAQVMATWGAVAIAPSYSYGKNDTGVPRDSGGASALSGDIFRAQKARGLLSCLAGVEKFGVDTSRLAMHGHSLGSFLTNEVLEQYPDDYLAASHTAGGDDFPGGGVAAGSAALIKTPYALFHGCIDPTVPVADDVSLADALQTAGTPFELYLYPGLGHPEVENNAMIWPLVRAWYEEFHLL